MAIDDKHKEFVVSLEQTIKIIGKMGIRIEDFKKGYVKIKLPKEPNVNHIGTVYAGSLFSVADFTGGVLFFATFDHRKYYPLLKEATITFKKPATTDITVEAAMTPEQIERIRKIADEAGKSDWVMDLELKDEQGNVCGIVSGSFQMRKV